MSFGADVGARGKTCYFTHVGVDHYCDFTTDRPTTITFADSLRLEQDFVSNNLDAERWIGAGIPVAISAEEDSRYGYTETQRDGLATFRYVIGAEDLEAAEPF